MGRKLEWSEPRGPLPLRNVGGAYQRPGRKKDGVKVVFLDPEVIKLVEDFEKELNRLMKLPQYKLPRSNIYEALDLIRFLIHRAKHG